MMTYKDFTNYVKQYPTDDGRFGEYGGAYLPPELVPAFQEIDDAYETICHSAQFISELRRIRKEFQGRPTPVYHCERLSRKLGKCQIYLKREDLNHTGAHKLNHCMGEGLLAKFLGKKKLIAETGAGQHGVALATAAAYFGLDCDIYMGEVDVQKQAPNVTRMKLLGARVIPVTFGLRTLKEAVDAAFEAYLKEYEDAIYCIGSAVGPHPFPKMVRDFQMVVGIEAKEQFKEMTGLLPDIVTACVGGGSNAAGLFIPFLRSRWKSSAWSRWGAARRSATMRLPLRSVKKESCTDLKASCCRTTPVRRSRSTALQAAWTIRPSVRNMRFCTTPAACGMKV